jgi:AsmA family protein
VSPRLKRLLKITAATLLSVLLVIGGALLALALFDWNHARGWIARQVEERTGRALVIAGNLEVHPFSFHPRVRAERVTFANSDWGEAKPMLDAESVEFSFGLLPLLFQGRVVIPDLSLSGAEVLLQREKDGRRNWILKAPGDTAEGRSPEILQLAVEKSRLRVKDIITDTDMGLAIQSKAGDAVYAIDLAAEGRVRGVPLKMKGASGGLLRLMDDRTPYPIRIEGTLGGARASAEGTLTGVIGNADVDASMKLSGGNLAPLGDVLQISLPHTKPYTLSGKLERRGPQWKFSRFSGTVGKSDLGGDFAVDTAGERPVLTAALHSKSLDIADLGGFVGMEPGNAPAAKAPGKVLPSAPISLDKLRRVDAHVHLVAVRVQDTTVVPLDNLDAKLNLVDGVFKLEPIVFGIAKGTLNSTVVVDARKPRLATGIDSAFHNLHLDKLIPGTAKLDAAIGAVDGSLKLHGTGNSIAAMLGSSSGRVDFYSGGGKVSNLLLEYAGADVAEIVKFWVGGDRQVQLRCAVASFKVTDGLAASETLVVDTDDTVIGGKGSVNLKEESLDLTLTPLPKDFSILALRGPLRVTGSFADPKIGLEKKSLARKIGAAVLLGLINPLAAILPLIETGPGKNAPCADLLATVEAAAKGRKAP